MPFDLVFISLHRKKHAASASGSYYVPAKPQIMKKNLLALVVLSVFTFPVLAQEEWDLERCIREALEKSLLIKQFQLNTKGAEITAKQLRMERLPSLNGSTNAGVSFGRVVNPATNNFETENSFYQSLGLNSGVLLFNGFRLQNSIRQSDIQTDASVADMQQAQNDLALNVALAYLNVLFAYENLEIAEARVGLSKQQLSDFDKLIAAGARPENDRFDLVAQVATDEQNVVTAQNNIETNLLSLKQQMWMEPDFQLAIQRPEIDLETLEALENESLSSIYSAALTSQPQIRAAELRQLSSGLGVRIAKGQLWPSLSIGGDIGTNWSDLAKEFTGFTTVRIPQPGVYINGQATQFEVESDIPIGTRTISYSRQLDNNIGYGFGASLSIPIFNNYATRANIEKAKIAEINASIETDQTKQTLKTNIQSAIAAARAAKKSLEASTAAADASRIALDNAVRKNDLGTINTFEYLSARNRYDTAENNRLIARYEYFFRIKVLEYYLGRGLSLN